VDADRPGDLHEHRQLGDGQRDEQDEEKEEHAFSRADTGRSAEGLGTGVRTPSLPPVIRWSSGASAGAPWLRSEPPDGTARCDRARPAGIFRGLR